MTTAEGGSGAAEIAGDASAGAPGGDDTQDQEGQQQQENRASRYRRQLREAEAERDGLRERVETMQRSSIEQMAADAGVTKPSAIWAGGMTIADVVDEHGDVDPDKADAAIRSAILDMGLAVKAKLRPDPSQGSRGGPSQPAEASWQDLISGRAS